MKYLVFAVLVLALCCVTAAACAEVTVKFDVNGGSTKYQSLKLEPDAYGTVRFRLPETAPVRSGYRFIGWYCKGLEMEYGLCAPGESIAFGITKGTLTYVAQWENNRHQESCPYLMAWTTELPVKSDIIQVDFKCIQEARATYYAVLNWYDMNGYAGFQILEDGRHVVIMSMWDNGSVKPTIEYAPYAFKAQAFDGEGTGKQVLSTYDWSKLRWYTMRIQARTSGSKTVYEQWIRPEDGSWTKICAISYPQRNCGFKSVCAFLEDFYPFTNLRRSMQLRNMSGRAADTGKWKGNKRYTISNYEDNRLQTYNVNYNCKAEPANSAALYMQIGGGGYEKVITVPKDVKLKTCEILDQYMLD